MPKKKPTEKPSGRIKKSLSTISAIMNQLSTAVYGVDVTDDVTDELNNRFNSIMKDELNKLTDDGRNDLNSFIGKLYSDERGRGRLLEDIAAGYQIGGNEMTANPADFITEQYRNKLVKEADAYNISNQLIELLEAKSTMRDAIVSPDLNTGRINRQIVFDSTTVNDASKDYLPVIEAMEKKFNTPKLIKDTIVDSVLGYGEYYAYTAPYQEIFQNFSRKFKSGNKKINGRRFFEAADPAESMQYNIDSLAFTEAAQGNLDSTFIERVTRDISAVLKPDATDKQRKSELTSDVTTLLNERITVSTSPIPIPILEDGLEAFQGIMNTFLSEDCDHFSESTDFFEARSTANSKSVKAKQSREMNTGRDDYLKRYGGEHYDGFYNKDTSKKDEKAFSDIKDCYVKMVPPTRMLPVKIMGQTIFYIYILTDDATPLSSILAYSAQMRSSDPSNRVNQLINDVAERIVNKFDEAFVRDNAEFKQLIVSALQFYDMGNQKIHFQVVPKQYVTAFKINEDLDGNGHSMLEPSLFYAKLYLMIFMFKIMTILTKSNDQQINYIRTSGIDKNAYNKAQEIARQKQSRRITLNDMFSYTNVVNKVAAGSEIFMPLSKSGEKPIETEILQGQDVQLNTDLLENLRNSYILGSGVPSAIINYLNEADFAKSIETANTKMHGRVVNYQIDLNDPITEWYRKMLRYSTNIPEEVVASVKVILPPPKGSSNVTTQELLNNYNSLEEYLVKLHFGDDTEESAEAIMKFKKGLAKMHLPMINFTEIESLYKEALKEAVEQQLVPKDDGLDDI